MRATIGANRRVTVVVAFIVATAALALVAGLVQRALRRLRVPPTISTHRT